MMEWKCEIPISKNNGGLSHYLVVAVPKQKSIVGRLEI